MSRDELTIGQLLDIVLENGLCPAWHVCGRCEHHDACRASWEAIAELRRRDGLLHRWRLGVLRNALRVAEGRRT